MSADNTESGVEEELHDLGRKAPHALTHLSGDELELHLRSVVLSSGNTLVGFEAALEAETEEYLKNPSYSKLSEAAVREKRDGFVGDLFEMFAELFLNYYANGQDYWPRDYESRHGTSKKDMGADGRGRNHLDHDMAVQIKYRRMEHNPNRQIEYSGDHLSNLIPDAWRTYKIKYPGIPIDDETFSIQHCIVSNAAGTSLAFQDASEGLIMTILRDDLSRIDGDLPFWEWAERFTIKP